MAAAAAYPPEWQDFLAAPVFVINLARCPDRWTTTEARLKEAGFSDIRRWEGVDAGGPNGNAALAAAWQRHGSPPMDPSDHEFCWTYKGKQGCMLSHLDLLQHVIENRIPYFIVMEDDVLFHPEWKMIGPVYYDVTPKDYDLLYLGSQLETPSEYSIVRLPCFCTNAMAMPLAGAERVYKFLLSHPSGVRTIDCMLKDHQMNVVRGQLVAPAFEWYVWNGRLFPTKQALMSKDWTKRNTGLVFQDVQFGSEVRPW